MHTLFSQLLLHTRHKLGEVYLVTAKQVLLGSKINSVKALNICTKMNLRIDAGCQFIIFYYSFHHALLNTQYRAVTKHTHLTITIIRNPQITQNSYMSQIYIMHITRRNKSFLRKTVYTMLWTEQSKL